jgi:para-nitrobenzyl esterase
MELQTKTGHAPVYRYLFMRGPPTDFFGVSRGSYHSAEILYVFGTLDSQVKTPWAPEDRKVSELTQSYWLNFARFGNPNGPGLPRWPAYGSATGWSVLRIDVHPEAKPDEYRAGYQFLKERG